MGEKRKINGWLIDQDFLDKVEFHDLYYFNSLTRHIHDFILNCPTPLSTYWDKNLSTIFFMVGDKKFGFKVDSDISYYDYITLVERDLKKILSQI